MAILPAGVVRQSQIAEHVAAIAEELARDVVRIRYSIDPDWSDDWAIFFRVLLTDDASSEERRPEVIRRVRERLMSDPEIAESGLLHYFNFRNEAEQKILQEKAWS